MVKQRSELEEWLAAWIPKLVRDRERDETTPLPLLQDLKDNPRALRSAVTGSVRIAFPDPTHDAPRS